jgi:integrase
VVRVTVNQLLDAYLTDQELRGLKSVYKVRAHAVSVREAFGPMRAVDVTAERVDAYIAARRQAGKKNATVNRALQIISSAFTLAVRRRTLTHAPSIRKLSEAGNAKQGFFERDEFETVLAHLPEHIQDAARFAYACGWRKGEVVGLTWSMVDRTRGRPPCRTQRARPRARARRRRRRDHRRRERARLVETSDGDVKVADYVFHRNNGRPLGDFNRSWHAALEAAGFSHAEKHSDGSTRRVYDKTVHDFRRTRSVFDRYNITSTDDVRAAMEAVSLPTSGEAR